MTLEKRYSIAIERLGGAPGILALPAQIKEALKKTTDLTAKVKMLEEIVRVKSGLPKL